MKTPTKEKCRTHQDFRRLSDEPCEWCEIQAHRQFLETVFPPSEGFCEDFDLLESLGLIVEVKPSREFMEYWGDDTPMWVYAWHAHEFEPVEDDDHSCAGGITVILSGCSED
jgi:hypothetical protein